MTIALLKHNGMLIKNNGKLLKRTQEEPVPENSVKIGDRWYPYVQFGNQLWLAENLDYKYDGLTVAAPVADSTKKLAAYYNNDEATYGEQGNKYGLLYNYKAASYLSDNAATLMPNAEGWHLPTAEDIAALDNAYDAFKTQINLPNAGIWQAGNFAMINAWVSIWVYSSDSKALSYYNNSYYQFQGISPTYFVTVRLVKNLT